MARTGIRGDTGDDDLLLSGLLNGLPKFCVIPRIDLSVALDEWGIGIHVQDILGNLSFS